MSETTPFTIATRGSKLALWQANRTRELLLAARPEQNVELLTVESSGDADQKSELGRFGRTGIFTAEVDNAVLSGRARCGVHSLKDMTTSLPEGLVLAGTLARGPVEDVLVSRTGAHLMDLPVGARVATGSVRRIAMLRRRRPDLQIVGIRGNVDTRLSKLARGEADALVMARAGLVRLGFDAHITEVLDLEHFLPAVGQGIVGLTCRSQDIEAQKRLSGITDEASYFAALAERALLAGLHGGCNAPVGAQARCVESALSLRACVLSLDGRECIEEAFVGSIEEAERIGRELASRLAQRGAKRLIESARAAQA
ncbi:MAG: hydroxymethylbilane synthase [Planctomycetes bacterium]|nr:hydroxymethylbilane synthase [Planctomycetota bacterium]